MLKYLRENAALFLLLLFLATPGYAYLDPGTGSMILQGVIAGIAAASLTLKIFWYRIKMLFSRGRDKEQPVVETVEAGRQDDTRQP